MKKNIKIAGGIGVLLVVGVICVFLLGTPANNTNPPIDENKFTPDISIDQIDWNVGTGTIYGENYVIFEITNNSQYVITGFKLTFTEKAGISKSDKDAFYADIQKSQGFDDAWMQEFIESREELSQPISMYVNINETIEVGEVTDNVKCYYFGGWTSKNVIYPDLFVPDVATIKYEKDGVVNTLYYNFAAKTYDLETTN